MLPGPDQIIACPHCKGLAKYMTLMSGNTIGAQVWTDGRRVAPMLPRPPAVVKCRHCGECYWLADAEKVGTFDPWRGEGQQVNPSWATAEEVQEPTEEEYYRAMEKGLATDPKQEKRLRVLAWWRSNDTFRDDPRAPAVDNPSGSELWRKNLEALANLLHEADENDRLMKAEVLRELGEFELAKQVLGRIDSSKMAAVVRQVLSLCDSGDTRVRELELRFSA
jgi:hypothetical protein